MPLPDPLITISPEFLSGAPIFTGTRVPVQTLFDHLEAGDPLDVFLDDFPNVSREHATAVLKASKAAVILHTIEQESYHATAEGNELIVLHIRHSSRKPPKNDEI
jgi:uncharacterized protein (DUF433 family)